MDKQLPTFKLIGRPRQLPTHGVKSTNYYQLYRLPPATKVLRAPCCDDFKQSQSMAASYVVAHIEKGLAKKTKPNYAELTIEQHLANYKEALEADDDSRKHVQQTVSRIKTICKGCGWKMIDDIDGLRAKSFVKRLTCGDMTKGYHLSSLKSFTKALAENGRIPKDPLLYLKIRKKGDKPKPTRVRRALTEAEIRLLIETAEKSQKVVQRLDGPTRAMLYRLAVSIGFRAHELSSLTPLSFTLDRNACVLLERQVSKRRRYDRVEIRVELADRLRRWLADRHPTGLLFPGFWWNRAASLLRHDLTAAKIAEKNHEGVIDFHSLRTTFITRLVGTSAPVSMVQRIARLSTPSLLARYYKPHDSDRRETIEKMPVLC